MKIYCGALALLALTGCAVVDDRQAPNNIREDFKSFEPILDSVGQDVVEHGVVTIENVLNHSDVVTIPESDQHVIWTAPNPILTFETADEGLIEPNLPREPSPPAIDRT
ncbi:MAG: hypothetical protein GKR90_25305 [Pseudomonadales bacterium]|nr:hypothetical protein [Pseudomonadales bacterium]